MPIVKRVNYKDSPCLQIGAIFEDEGTIAGVYRLHEELNYIFSGSSGTLVGRAGQVRLFPPTYNSSSAAATSTSKTLSITRSYLF